MRLLQQLQGLPDEWGLVAVGPNKRAYQKGWQNNPLTKEQAAAEITAGRAMAIGVLAGPASGGLLLVDHDGISATAELERLGFPLRSLPKSVSFTSGRDGRFQIAYRIPPEYWPALRNRRVFYTGKLDDEGKKEQLDLRWAGHYSVVIGHHPQTTGYRWFRGTSPIERAVADAPLGLIELLLDTPEPEPTPLLAPLAAPAPAAPAAGPPPHGGPLPLLDFVSRTSRDLIESGGTPGSWNDDQLRLALDLRGTEAWICAQGHRPDISASQAFELHIAAARSKGRDFDDRKAWARFNGADAHAPTPSTPHDKLLERLSFHTRHTRPLLPPSPQPQAQKKPGPSTSPAAPSFTSAATDSTGQQQAYAPAFAKPSKLEAGELLAMLRAQAAGGRIRFNTFSQLIEIDGKALEGSERFYLSLAEQGFKVSKELALDCLVQVARENPYDPVRLYLEHVEATVEPTFINSLATAYLRPEDAAAGQPTLYDHMLRCTLIGAVRRVFEPGWKHDTACILLGDQGARKSSFWSVLGGAFFSDALGDISSKDDLMVLHRSWIMEWGEIDRITSRKHAGQVKQFLSQSTDFFRVPYGKATEAFPRRGIIVGSTNRSTGFLQDDTGNRRFWMIPVTRTEADPIDTPTLATERDAIWAAAVAAYRAGEKNFLPSNLAQQVTTENEAYQVENPWRVPIETWLRNPANFARHVTSELLLTEAIQKPIERQTRADQMQVGQIMRDLGFDKRRQTVDGTLKWTFFQP